mgnify:CR=1 FL=1
MPDKEHRKGIVSFDLDMTLLDHGTWKIPASAMRAIERLRREYIIVIASGRNMDAPYSVTYRDWVKPDAIIHLNGTRVSVGDQVLYEHLMEKEKLRALLDFAQEHQLSVGITDEQGDFYTCPDQVRQMDMERWQVSDRKFRDPWLLMDRPVKTLAYVGGPEGAKLMEEHFPDFKFPMFAGNQGADIVEQEASKAMGLRRLCEYYGINLSHTIAFGDSMNDLEIIEEAGVGVAMGNALPAIKEAADYVTDPIDKDGVWNACVKLRLFSTDGQEEKDGRTV